MRNNNKRISASEKLAADIIDLAFCNIELVRQAHPGIWC